MAHKKTFNIGLFNYVASYMLLVVGGILSFFATLHILIFPAAMDYFYDENNIDMLGSAAVLYNVAVVAFYTYWLSLPTVTVITVIALKKEKIIFWLPLIYLILNIFLFFFFQGHPYWEGFSF